MIFCKWFIWKIILYIISEEIKMREFCELYKTLIELCNSTLNSAKSDIIISSSTTIIDKIIIIIEEVGQ